MRRPIARVDREFSDLLAVLGLNLLFLAVVALILWPMGKVSTALSLTKGFGVLWVAVSGSVVLLSVAERALGLDPDRHHRTYISVNLLVSALLVAGWAAFAALTVRTAAADGPLWAAAVECVIGLLSSYLAFAVATSYYSGSVYKVVNLPLALVSYLGFASWPAAGRAAYGWLFSLLG